jgi:formate dehydrogenase maturation protein FdhE
MAFPYAARGSVPPDARPTCPHCGASPVNSTTVPWYPELEYLTCESCKSVWTVQRQREQKERKDRGEESGRLCRDEEERVREGRVAVPAD